MKTLGQVRTASCGATACVNSFGDEQLAVDLLADKLLFEALRFSVSCTARCRVTVLYYTLTERIRLTCLAASDLAVVEIAGARPYGRVTHSARALSVVIHNVGLLPLTCPLVLPIPAACVP